MVSNLQRLASVIALLAIVVAVYFGRPRATTRSHVASQARYHCDQSRQSAREWMNQLPANEVSACALLDVLAADCEHQSAVFEALHRIMDSRVASASDTQGEFEFAVAEAMDRLSQDGALPIAVIEELADRLQNWPNSATSESVALHCASALEAAGRWRSNRK